jgi:uroporphyrinogen decarboxylase
MKYEESKEQIKETVVANSETMASRQRIIATLNREPTDRMPIDLGSHMSTGISAFAYWHLREHFGLTTGEIWIPDMVQLLACVDEDILKRFHCDCIPLEPSWGKAKKWKPRSPYEFTVPEDIDLQYNDDGYWMVRDKDGKGHMKMPQDGYFFSGDWLCRYNERNEDAALALYAKQAERIYKETDYAVNFLGYSRGPGILEAGTFFYGIEHAMQMLTDPEEVHARQERLCNESIQYARKVIDTLGEYIQLYSIGNDMGSQQRPLCNPAHIEEFCIPYYKRFCDFLHANSDIKIFLHSCGSIKPLIPLFIEAGIDVLNPVQISADDMEPNELKNKFGDKIIFWGGGCDTQNVLGAKGPDDVAEHVRKMVDIFKKDQGYVFTASHNILGNVPPEHIVAMYDAAYEEAFYQN